MRQYQRSEIKLMVLQPKEVREATSDKYWIYTSLPICIQGAYECAQATRFQNYIKSMLEPSFYNIFKNSLIDIEKLTGEFK
jgi:hypothetical protein